ncbi:unnamed protein product, partial [Ectocarpus sp. 4 AP-2014]
FCVYVVAYVWTRSLGSRSSLLVGSVVCVRTRLFFFAEGKGEHIGRDPHPKSNHAFWGAMRRRIVSEEFGDTWLFVLKTQEGRVLACLLMLGATLCVFVVRPHACKLLLFFVRHAYKRTSRFLSADKTRALHPDIERCTACPKSPTHLSHHPARYGFH